MRIKALINLTVSANKEIKIGDEYEIKEADAKKLIEKSFAVAVIKKSKPKPKEQTGEDDEQLNDEENSDEPILEAGDQGDVSE